MTAKQVIENQSPALKAVLKVFLEQLSLCKEQVEQQIQALEEQHGKGQGSRTVSRTRNVR